MSSTKSQRCAGLDRHADRDAGAKEAVAGSKGQGAVLGLRSPAGAARLGRLAGAQDRTGVRPLRLDDEVAIDAGGKARADPDRELREVAQRSRRRLRFLLDGDDDVPGPEADDVLETMTQQRDEALGLKAEQKFSADVGPPCLDALELGEGIVPGVRKAHAPAQDARRRRAEKRDRIALQEKPARGGGRRLADAANQNGLFLRHQLARGWSRQARSASKQFVCQPE